MLRVAGRRLSCLLNRPAPVASFVARNPIPGDACSDSPGLSSVASPFRFGNEFLFPGSARGWILFFPSPPFCFTSRWLVFFYQARLRIWWLCVIGVRFLFLCLLLRLCPRSYCVRLGFLYRWGFCRFVLPFENPVWFLYVLYRLDSTSRQVGYWGIFCIRDPRRVCCYSGRGYIFL